MEEEEDRRREEEEKRREREHKRHKEEEGRKREEGENLRAMESHVEEVKQEEVVQYRLEETSASLAAAVQAVEHKINEEDAQNE